MAKKEKPTFDYGAHIRRLRQEGPAKVYVLRGAEDYLRDSFLAELRKLCVEEGTEAFNHHRLTGPKLDVADLISSAEAMPFMGERTLTEVWDFDINHTSNYDPEALKAFLSDVPDWATVAFVFSPEYNPDSRLTAMKAMKKAGIDLEFTAPREGELIRWVTRRAESQDKTIDSATAGYLIWVCGERMNTLIPEITKIAGHAAGKSITRADIDAVAKKAPETTIFNMIDALGDGEYDKAARMLSELLVDKEAPPPKQIFWVGDRFRRLYVARLAADTGRGDSYIEACIPELAGQYFRIKLLKNTCKKYSRERLARAVIMCAQCEYRMKDTGGDPEALLKELILRLALDKV